MEPVSHTLLATVVKSVYPQQEDDIDGSGENDKTRTGRECENSESVIYRSAHKL